MSAITEGLQTEMNDIASEVSALESRINEGQQRWKKSLRSNKKVTSIVEKQKRHFRESIEATRRYVEAQLAAVDARCRLADVGGPGAKSSTVKLLKFEGATSWAVFRRQFEAATVQNNWTSNEKAARLSSVLQGKAADIFHTLPAEATYEDIVGAV
jgi:hypothetical protein